MSSQASKIVCSLLRQSILQLCKASIPEAEGVKVDGIVCIALGKHTEEQIVVKIHELLWDETYAGAPSQLQHKHHQQSKASPQQPQNIHSITDKKTGGGGILHNALSAGVSRRIESSSPSKATHIPTRPTPPPATTTTANSSSKAKTSLSLPPQKASESHRSNNNTSPASIPATQPSRSTTPVKKPNKRKSSCPVNLFRAKQPCLELEPEFGDPYVSDEDRRKQASSNGSAEGPEIVDFQMGNGGGREIKKEKVDTFYGSEYEQYKTNSGNYKSEQPQSQQSHHQMYPEPICIEPMTTPIKDSPSAMYICDICKLCFSDNAAYTKHIETTQHGHVNTCQYCNRRFTNFNSFVFHMRSHGISEQNSGDFWKGKPLRCGICSLLLRSKRGIIEHMRTEHNYVKCYTCVSCEEIYPDFNSFKAHRNRMHGAINQCRCDMCELFFTFTEFKDHEKECMIKIYVDQDPKVKPTPYNMSRSSFNENDIENSMDSEGAMDIVPTGNSQHHNSYENVTIVDDKQPDVLQVMSPSNTKEKRISHNASPVLKPTEGPFRCQSCFLVFPEFEVYETHNHEMHSRFVCSYCAQSFATRRNLQRHSRRHTGVRPYQCQDCDASFTRDDDLKKHMFRNNHLSGYSSRLPGKVVNAGNLTSFKDIKFSGSNIGLFGNGGKATPTVVDCGSGGGEGENVVVISGSNNDSPRKGINDYSLLQEADYIESYSSNGNQADNRNRNQGEDNRNRNQADNRNRNQGDNEFYRNRNQAEDSFDSTYRNQYSDNEDDFLNRNSRNRSDRNQDNVQQVIGVDDYNSDKIHIVDAYENDNNSSNDSNSVMVNRVNSPNLKIVDRVERVNNSIETIIPHMVSNSEKPVRDTSLILRVKKSRIKDIDMSDIGDEEVDIVDKIVSNVYNNIDNNSEGQKDDDYREGTSSLVICEESI